MKINGMNINQVNPYRHQQQGAQPAKSKGIGASSDQIKISDEAKLLQEVTPYEKERLERIHQIKAKVEAGTYVVDNEELAKSIVSYYDLKG